MIRYTLTSADTVCGFMGPAYEAAGEDGMEIRCVNLVGLDLADGRRFTHTRGFGYLSQATTFADKIRAAGVVDLSLWEEQEVMSLEEKFDLYAQHEYEVGHGLRAPHDLYHGIPL